MHTIKWIIGVLLLPAACGVTINLVQTLSMVSGQRTGLGWSVWGLGIGFGLWLICYSVMPRPVRTYVWAHELTHAVWGWAFGAKVKGIKVSDRGGHVKLSHTNFLVTLAPYFFPFYTMLVILAHSITSLFYDTGAYEPIWMGWIGLTWGFHFTFTLFALRLAQPDIAEHGRLFSYVVIFIMNVLGICAWIVAVTDIPWNTWFPQIGGDITHCYVWLWDRAVQGGDALYQRYAL